MRRSLAAVATAVALAGLGAAPAAAAPVTDPPAHTQGCTVSTFQVVWGEAGIYEGPGGRLVDKRYYGNRVTGPTGYTGGGWTWVYYPFPYSQHVMRDAALQFLYCS